MNKIILVGRLVAEPKYFESNGDKKSVANYRLAVDRNKKDAPADFFDVKAFDRNADFANQYLHKGTQILVEGKLQNDNYKRNDGTTAYHDCIVVDRHEFVGPKAANDAAAAAAPAENGFMDIPEGIDEELPFN